MHCSSQLLIITVNDDLRVHQSTPPLAVSGERLLFDPQALGTLFSGSEGRDAHCGCGKRSPSCQEGRDDSASIRSPAAPVPVCVDLGGPSNGNEPKRLFHQMGSILQAVLTVPLWPRVQSTGKKCGKDGESLNLHLRQWQSGQRANKQYLGTAALFYIRNHNTGRCEFRGYSSTLKKKTTLLFFKKKLPCDENENFLTLLSHEPSLKPTTTESQLHRWNPFPHRRCQHTKCMSAKEWSTSPLFRYQFP